MRPGKWGRLRVDRIERQEGARRARDQNMTERRRAPTHLLGEWQIVEALIPGGNDIGDRLGIFAEMRDLAFALRGKGKDRQSANAEEGDRQRDEIGDVRQLHEDALAPANAETDQPRRQPIGAPVERAVAEALLSSNEGDPLAVHLRPGAQKITEPLTPPIAALAVTIGERRRPGRETRVDEGRNFDFRVLHARNDLLRAAGGRAPIPSHSGYCKAWRIHAPADRLERASPSLTQMCIHRSLLR